MSQVLAVVAVATPRVDVTYTLDATSPNVNIILLHSVGVTSTYMCIPVLVPQIVGGVDEALGPVTEKVSTKQLVLKLFPKAALPE